LIVRLLGIFVTPYGSLALLARFLTATLLLTGRLVLLAGLALVCHVVSFHWDITTTDQSPRRSDKRKMAVRIAAAMWRTARHFLVCIFLVHCFLCFQSLAIAPS
jgi:hypothetical protein